MRAHPLLLLLLASTRLLAAEAPSEYRSLGPRFEIKVQEDGLYRVTYEMLVEAGLGRDPVPASSLSLKSQGQEVAIVVEGGEDGRFGPGDSILFYGEKFRGDRLAAEYAHFMNDRSKPGWLELCRNCRLGGMFEEYTETNVYWLLIGAEPGLRMEGVDARPRGAARAESYLARLRREESRIWWIFEMESEDSWFWDRINDPVWTVENGQTATKTVERSYPFRVSGLAPGEHEALVRVGLVSRQPSAGKADHRTQFAVNDTEPLLDETWSGGKRRQIDIRFSQSKLKDGENLLRLVELPHTREGSLVDQGIPWIYFDWFEVSYARRFLAEDNRLFFDVPAQSRREFRVDGFAGTVIAAYDITDPARPRRLLNLATNPGTTSSATFELAGEAGARILVAGGDSIKKPDSVTHCKPPDFRTMAEADYLIITHPFFLEQVRILADYRQSKGLKAAVVNVEDLYREFNHGIFHPVAIRNFLVFTFQNWAKPPRYVVLVGGGHWNFKRFPVFPSPPMYIPPNLAYVDPFQGEVDSTTLLATLTGDDLIPDLHIGRIPANNQEELERYIRKVIAYESLPAADGQPQAVFVADNTPDRAGDFVATTNRLIDTYFGSDTGLGVNRIFSDQFNCRKANSPECGRARDAIVSVLNSGQALFLNFLGHATATAWTHEEILSVPDLSRLASPPQLPILLSMTCLDGYWYHAGKPSLVRELLFAPGGVVAAFAPTGMGLTSGHDVLHRGFYEALFKRGIWEIGPAVMEARKRLYESKSNLDLLHTYVLFGDPALQIRRPPGGK